MTPTDKSPSATDDETTVAELRRIVRRFVDERQWRPHHAPKNLAMSLAIEAAELMEHFQWLSVEASRELPLDEARRAAAGEELADVICYALAMADELGLDVSQTLRDKMAKNATKYPVEKYQGNYEKPPRGE